MIDFDDRDEAHYLCAMLQSSVVRQAVNRIQPRGKKGARVITDRPLQLPIPDFITDEKASDMSKQGISDSDIEYLRDLQLELTRLSMELHDKVQELLKKYVHGKYGIPFVNVTDKVLAPQSVAAIRKKIRSNIAEYQEKIDELAIEIINSAPQINAGAKTLLDYLEL